MAGKKQGALLLIFFVLGGLMLGFGLPILALAWRLANG